MMFAGNYAMRENYFIRDAGTVNLIELERLIFVSRPSNYNLLQVVLRRIACEPLKT